MKIIFNDATELQVQKVEQKGDYLRVLTVSATPEQLRRIFEDIVKTATMVVEERGQKGEPLVGYTTFYRTEEYPGKNLWNCTVPTRKNSRSTDRSARSCNHNGEDTGGKPSRGTGITG